MTKTRDFSIDILRAIALMGIVCIHIKPSIVLAELRNFDVSLMVFLSGISFAISNSYKSNIYLKKGGYWQFVRKRIVRLIFPTWIFLILFVSAQTVVNGKFPFRFFMANMSLCSGWYIWIIRVMFVCSLSAPLLTKYLKGINPIKYAILLLTGFSVAELIGINSDMSVPWQYFISYHFAYILVFYMGLSIFTQSRKIQIGTLVVCVSVYLISVGIQWQEYGQFCQTISYKYPPRIYYISYALSITYTLWIFRGHLEKWCTNLHLAKFLQFVGSHSIWIYFWHIPIVTWFDAQEQTYPNATIRFFIAFGVSTGIVFLQDIVVGLVTSHCKNERTNKLIKTLFIG